MAMIKKPSSYQLAIFNEFQTGTGNIAISAVAGSGKTSTIEHLCGLIDSMDLMDTLFCCFNKSIQTELKNRLPNRVNVATFHSLGKVIIEDAYNVRTHKQWVNGYKYKNIVDELMEDMDYSYSEDYEKFESLKKAINYCQLQLIDPDDSDAFSGMLDYWEITSFPNLSILTAKALKIGLKQAQNGECIDFNDMIWIPATQKDIKRRKYAYILVDECQDFNAAQLALIDSLRRDDTKLVAVGDPRQAIYGFAGADTSSFDKVVSTFNAKIMPLSVSYRCGQNIVKEAQKYVPEIEFSDNAEYGEVLTMSYQEMVSKLNPKAEDMVVCRINAPLLGLAFELLEKEIPCKIKGRDFLNGLMSIARQIVKKSGSRWTIFETELDDYLEAERARLMKRANNEMKLSNLEDKVSALGILYRRSQEAGIVSFDQFTKWVEDIYTDYETHGCVVLSSVHKAKGLEAGNVFILDPSIMPHPMAETPEQRMQEFNLLYVAITRAKNRLVYADAKVK